jgi:flagellar hook protein FlgE
MMRSLFAGVSGLQNHQTRMDVIGNNIANVNTTGFKRGRVNFQDLLSQTQAGSSRPNERVGGVNPQQVGLGMNIASIDTIHTQGSLQTTGVKTDLAIQGDGFFVMRAGDQLFYSRAGAFSLDANGTLVNPSNGMRVQGYQAEIINGQTFINTSADVGDLVIPIGGKDPARATSQVFMASNLDKRTPLIPDNPSAEAVQRGTWIASKEIFDPFGGTLRLEVEYTRIEDGVNLWNAQVRILDNEGNPVQVSVGIGGLVNDIDDTSFQVQFDNFGTLESVSNAAGGLSNTEDLFIDIAFLVPETSIPDVIDPEEVNPAFIGAPGEPITQTFSLNIGGVGSFTNSTTQFSSESSNKIVEQDGYRMGYLQDFRIDQSGTITGIFTNGTNRSLGQVALASFRNPGGLEKAGENNYVVTINSGDADIGPSGVAGKGRFIAGALEMSNVDLAAEFTDMIITQRGFQSNSKTIQTADQMLQELLTLKR